jgi:hypothetical protein
VSAVPDDRSFFGPHAKYDMDSPEFERQTTICDSLPHASTVAHMDNNWRKAADELIRYLNDRGYDVVKVPPVEELAELIYRLHGCSCEEHPSNGVTRTCTEWRRNRAQAAAEAILDAIR